MKITTISLGSMGYALKRPFVTALRRVEYIEDIVVRVETDDGVFGFGEAAPTAKITGETRESILSAIANEITPALIGLDLRDLEGVLDALDKSIMHNTSAKAAVDIALYDAYSRSCSLPLRGLLGAGPSGVKTDLTISLGDADTMVADALSAVAAGFDILKLKVGLGGSADAQTIASIRRAVGDDVELRVDANQGWSPRVAVETIRAIEDSGCKVSLVEQPVSAMDLQGMRFVVKRVETPILADECVFTPLDALRVIETQAADMINIKLMKTSGIRGALSICEIARTLGCECMIGCMLEGPVSVAAAAHLASARGVITMADLDGPLLCENADLPGGTRFAPIIIPNETPGLGITLPAFSPINV